MWGGLTEGERTLREDWPVTDGSWRRAGAEELPCELVREWRFLGSEVPVKQLRCWRKGMGIERERGMGWGRLGEQGQCWEHNPIQVMAPNVRKNKHLHRSQRKLTRRTHVQQQGLTAQEKGEFGPGMAFYRQGRVRGWHMCRGP
jgi:hypothetical protein